MQKSGGLNYRSEDAGIWQRPHSGLCLPATVIFSPFVKDQFNKVLPGTDHLAMVRTGSPRHSLN